MLSEHDESESCPDPDLGSYETIDGDTWLVFRIEGGDKHGRLCRRKVGEVVGGLIEAEGRVDEIRWSYGTYHGTVRALMYRQVPAEE